MVTACSGPLWQEGAEPSTEALWSEPTPSAEEAMQTWCWTAIRPRDELGALILGEDSRRDGVRRT
jgi:hypothetical protein